MDWIEYLNKDETNTENIDWHSTLCASLRLLWAMIITRAVVFTEQSPFSFSLCTPRESQVGNFEIPIKRDEAVPRIQVVVNDSSRVDEINGLDELREEIELSRYLEAAFRAGASSCALVTKKIAK